jgi:hypothetical protein
MLDVQWMMMMGIAPETKENCSKKPGHCLMPKSKKSKLDFDVLL